MIPPRISAPSALSLLVALASCTYENQAALEHGPERPSLVLVRSQPAAGQLLVPRAAAVELVFDRALDATSVSQLAVRVFSGLIEASGRVQVDLLQRSLRFTPLRALRPNLRYRVYLSEEIRGLDGASLHEPLVFDFTTGETEGSPPASPAPVDLEDLQPLWDQHCVTGCHSAAQPRANLDLSSPQAAFRSLWGVGSNQWDLLLVEPGDHARSYLLRKLLDQGGTVGFAMPPQGNPLARDELQRVADWIDAGSTAGFQ